MCSHLPNTIPFPLPKECIDIFDYTLIPKTSGWTKFVHVRKILKNKSKQIKKKFIYKLFT